MPTSSSPSPQRRVSQSSLLWQEIQFLAGGRIDIQAPLLRFGQSAGSLMVLLNASRMILTRSAGTPGGKNDGRPNSSEASTTLPGVSDSSARLVLIHQFIKYRHIF